jgi:Domain of unknown function (DUF4157)
MGDVKAAKDVSTPEAIIAAPEPKAPGVEKRDGPVTAPARTMRTPVSTGAEPGRARTMRTARGASEPLKRATAAQSPGVAAAPAVSRPHEPAEREAASVARLVAGGTPARPASQGAAGVARLTRTGPQPPDAAPAVEAAPLPGASPAAAPSQLPDPTAAAVASADPGVPIRPDVRRVLESRMGEDLADVRVHQGAQAHSAAQAIDARAFTREREIWLGPGESQDDVELMAHEVAHVIQGREEAGQASRLARAPAKGSPPKDLPDGTYTLEDTDVATVSNSGPNGKEIRFGWVPIPTFKGEAHRKTAYGTRKLDSKGLRRSRPYKRGRPKQDDVWKAALGPKLQGKLPKLTTGSPGETSTLKVDIAGKDPVYLSGSQPELERELTVPMWTDAGVVREYQVDHIVELQLADWTADAGSWPNTLPNLELLRQDLNSSSGATIRGAIARKAELAAKAAAAQQSIPTQSPATILQKYLLIFDNEKPHGGAGGLKDGTEFWSKESIEAGKHLARVTAVDPATLGKPGTFTLIPPKGALVHLRKQAREDAKAGQTGATPLQPDHTALAPYTATSIEPPAAPGGAAKIEMGIGKEHPALAAPSDKLPVQTAPGSADVGMLDGGTAAAHLAKGVTVKGTSPIEVDQVSVDAKGLLVVGRIATDIPLLADGTGIDFRIHGMDLTLSKTFSGPDFALPKPFSVTGSDLTIEGTIGPKGIGGGVKGHVYFAVEKVGSGSLGAAVHTRGGFALEGRFDFDPNLFDGYIALAYAEGEVSGEGKASLKKDAIPGIKSATIKASYAKGTLKADGAAELEVPGVKSGKLSLVHSEAEGLQMSGDFELTNDLPGIRSGTVHAKAVQHPDGSGYDLVMTGTAVTALPGLTAALAVTYERGSFTIEASGAYKRGMLDGTVLVGVTNRAIGSDNRPLPAPSTPVVPAPKKLRAYGGGSVGVTLTPWLRGVVGVMVRENGEIVVSGEIGIPAPLDVFPRKPLDKRLVDVSLDFPIAGFTVAGARVGVFGTVGGNLDLIAFVGPGQLRQAKLALTYNPSREEDTTVAGTAQFAVPAFAGLRLAVHVGIGVGAVVISATGGLELGGALGVAGEASADVTIRWTPTSGLTLDAEGRLSAEPSFEIDLTGFVRVDVDLFFWSATLWEQRWKLAGMKWGSGMTVGARFPIHYVEGKPFDIALSDIEFIYPKIDPKAVLAGVIDSTKESSE